MRRPKQFALVFLIAWAIAGVAARAAPAERALLAHAAGDALWVANVVPRSPEFVAPIAGSPAAGPAQQTNIWVRPSQPGKPWRVLAVLPGRVTSMASRDTQLAVLMAGGEWMTVFDGGSATGQPLPAGGQVVTLADDGRTLWAVGIVKGGVAKARAEIDRMAAATRPTFEQPYAFTTRPSTAAAAVSPVDPTSELPAPVVFRQDAGRWSAVAELPPGVVPDDLSVAVVGRTLTFAARASDGSIRTTRWHDGKWEEVARVTPGGSPASAAFTLLAPFDAAQGGANDAALWTTTGGADAGAIRPLVAGAAEADVRPLKWVGPPALSGTPAVAIAGGYLRVIGLSADKKPFEQRYEMTGARVGTPAEVVAPTELGDTALLVWIQGLLLASLAFAIGTSVYRQVTPGSTLNATPANGDNGAAPLLVPAPLAMRAAAGAIDLLPLVACVLIALIVNARHPESPLPTGVMWLVVTGVVIYLAHTTVLESLTARTAGKWITGLRVATIDGVRPAPWQLASRNLLRVLDPLIWIVLSPQRQRTADVLAGTIVVREAAPPGPPPPPSPGEPPSQEPPSSTPTEPGT